MIQTPFFALHHLRLFSIYHHFPAGLLGGICILGRGSMFQAYILFRLHPFYLFFSWCLTIATACVVACNDRV
ncbi:hypothetical protein BDW74DRAFT_151286 [Aspergillus multicolor]|uniref:uncharacterized protein n=1 Tax=Aspergillus multicolor TaxID=41759 RepID=UPI003CCDC48F